MTKINESSPLQKRLKSLLIKESFWANLISITSIVVAFIMLLWVTIPKSTPIAFFYLFFIPLPIMLCFLLNSLREDGELVWLKPILILMFSVGFVGYFFSETNDQNHLKYPEYKQVILNDLKLKKDYELKVKPNFDKIEDDGVIVRYEFIQILDALEDIRYNQKKRDDEKKKVEDDRLVKLIKQNLGK